MLASDRGCSEFSLSLRKSLRKILPRVTVERWGVCVCVCRAGWCESVPRRWKNKNKTLSPQKFKRCMLVSLVKQAWLMSIQHATVWPSKTVIREKSWWIYQDRSNESDSLWAHRPLNGLWLWKLKWKKSNKRIGSVFLFTGTRCDTPGVAIKNFSFRRKRKNEKRVDLVCVWWCVGEIKTRNSPDAYQTNIHEIPGWSCQ